MANSYLSAMSSSFFLAFFLLVYGEPFKETPYTLKDRKTEIELKIEHVPWDKSQDKRKVKYQKRLCNNFAFHQLVIQLHIEYN